MGCINSKEAGSGLPRARDTENQVNLILAAKRQRANVFTSGAGADENFRPKNISKSDKQRENISKQYVLSLLFY